VSLPVIVQRIEQQTEDGAAILYHERASGLKLTAMNDDTIRYGEIPRGTTILNLLDFVVKVIELRA
jgi:hypothetical protein